MCAHHAFLSDRSYRSSSKAKVAAAFSSDREAKSDEVCEIADAVASFQSEMWKHFPVSRNEKDKEVTDRQKTTCRRCRFINKAKFVHILSKLNHGFVNADYTF